MYEGKGFSENMCLITEIPSIGTVYNVGLVKVPELFDMSHHRQLGLDMTAYR